MVEWLGWFMMVHKSRYNLGSSLVLFITANMQPMLTSSDLSNATTLARTAAEAATNLTTALEADLSTTHCLLAT